MEILLRHAPYIHGPCLKMNVRFISRIINHFSWSAHINLSSTLHYPGWITSTRGPLLDKTVVPKEESFFFQMLCFENSNTCMLRAFKWFHAAFHTLVLAHNDQLHIVFPEQPIICFRTAQNPIFNLDPFQHHQTQSCWGHSGFQSLVEIVSLRLFSVLFLGLFWVHTYGQAYALAAADINFLFVQISIFLKIWIFWIFIKICQAYFGHDLFFRTISKFYNISWLKSLWFSFDSKTHCLY